MIHRALRVRVLGMVGLMAIVSALSCGGEELGSGRDAGADQAVGGAGHAGGGAGQAGGASGSAGAAGIAGNEGSIIEWRIPFADSQPYQITAWGTSVFYLNAGAEQMLGRLDTENDTVTEWPVSDPATSPGDVQVRPSDGAVFFTSATVGELRQFDPQSQLLLKWSLPLDVPPGVPPGPWSIAFDASGRVIFSAADASGPLIGRLDTVSGRLDVWSSPEGVPVRVGLAPDGAVIYPTSDPDSNDEVVRLDPTTGVFTTWAFVDPSVWGSVVDGAGDIFFCSSRPTSRGWRDSAPTRADSPTGRRQIYSGTIRWTCSPATSSSRAHRRPLSRHSIRLSTERTRSFLRCPKRLRRGRSS